MSDFEVFDLLKDLIFLEISVNSFSNIFVIHRIIQQLFLPQLRNITNRTLIGTVGFLCRSYSDFLISVYLMDILAF